MLALTKIMQNKGRTQRQLTNIFKIFQYASRTTVILRVTLKRDKVVETSVPFFQFRTRKQKLTSTTQFSSSYSTTNKMHLFLKLFILVKRSTCFGRSFRPSSGAQNCIYGNRHMSNSCCSSCLTYACCRICSFELLMMDGRTVRNM